MQVSVMMLCLILCAVPAFTQHALETEAQRRNEKVEMILRIQDLRTPHDGKLISYLADPDPIVREKATSAFGSLQDTTILGPLMNNLADADGQVALAAAFAIGQTGTQLGLRGRQELEYDLIWKRLRQSAAGERLIEEIGKFGTEEGLNDLMVRVGNVRPLQFRRGMIMSIARFAIRGITNRDAVRYLLQFLSPPDATPWEVVYALQRIGDHPETRLDLERLVLLRGHQDPLVRMNLAILLGKVHDERTSLDLLNLMAEHDSDWRVRVNALRSLANFNLREQNGIVSTFKRAFFDQNEHLILAALSAFANTNLDYRDTSATVLETFAQLEYLARNREGNFPWQTQAGASLTIARMMGSAALPSLPLPTWPQPRLRAGILLALGVTGSETVAETLLQGVKAEDPIIVCGALEGLQVLCRGRKDDTELREKAYVSILSALAQHDVSVVATAASILRDSLFLRRTSAQALVATLADLRLPDDLEAMQEVIAALGTIKENQAVPTLMNQLRQPDRTVAFAAAEALQRITGADYRSRIQWRTEPLYTDFDFAYLRSLPFLIPVRLETIKGNIVLELNREVAPFTVMSVLKLATQRGFYRGVPFHRVVQNFVVQGGDPRGDGWGGPGYTIRSEFSPLAFETGVVGIASAGKDTEGSQFFITHSPQPHLDGRYTIIGRVRSGMDVVDLLQADDRILDLKILSDSTSH